MPQAAWRRPKQGHAAASGDCLKPFAYPPVVLAANWRFLAGGYAKIGAAFSFDRRAS